MAYFRCGGGVDSSVLALPTINTVTNNIPIIQFVTDLAMDILSCKCTIVATESGSGAKSPSNPYIVDGFTGALISHSGADTSNPATYSIAFGRTVFGGKVDVASGKLELTHYGFTLTGTAAESWSISNAGTVNYYYVLNLPTGSASATAGTNVANIFPTVNVGNNNTNEGCYATSSALRVRWGAEMSIPDWKAWLSNNNLTVFYKLVNLLEFDLIPQQITALVGENNLWSDTGNMQEVTYFETVGHHIS